MTLQPLPHEYDDDAVCMHCGFDGAEWWHLKRAGAIAADEKKPLCTRWPAFTPTPDTSDMTHEETINALERAGWRISDELRQDRAALRQWAADRLARNKP